MKSQHSHRLRRSLLFMPGDSTRKIEKATTLGADSIIADLEDAVALSQKQAARETVVACFARLDFGPSERLIRINPVSTTQWEDDLAQTVAAWPDGYVLPKTQSAAEVQAVSQRLSALEKAHGLEPESLRLLVQIETGMGVLRAGEIAGADARVDALLFGAEDLASDIGAKRSREGWEIFYARGAVVTAAAAYGLPAIDTVYLELADTEGLATECHLVRGLGFSGKLAIHPRQVEVINRAFSPTAAEIAQAQRLIDTFESQQSAGTGVFEMDGKMIDMPVVLAARNVLAANR
ncbi:MAG: CoA ester lyase [Caldilineaceae bacterium]